MVNWWPGSQVKTTSTPSSQGPSVKPVSEPKIWFFPKELRAVSYQKQVPNSN